MHLVQQTKQTLKSAFPSAWLKWHLMRRPKSAEVELRYLKRVIPHDATTVDVGANLGLYTREMARCSKRVHAFEPSRTMADFLRRTSAPNVEIHETALSDHQGVSALTTPIDSGQPVHGLASIEPGLKDGGGSNLVELVEMTRLDRAVREDVAFVKVDVEGHELQVLHGAVDMIARSKPVFLVEAEDRHRPSATASVFAFFESLGYQGLFVCNDQINSVSGFDAATMQDATSLEPNGGRKAGRSYINNFFFFPPHIDGKAALSH